MMTPDELRTLLAEEAALPADLTRERTMPNDGEHPAIPDPRELEEALAALSCPFCGDLCSTELMVIGPGWRRLYCGSCDAEWTD